MFVWSTSARTRWWNTQGHPGALCRLGGGFGVKHVSGALHTCPLLLYCSIMHKQIPELNKKGHVMMDLYDQRWEKPGRSELIAYATWQLSGLVGYTKKISIIMHGLPL